MAHLPSAERSADLIAAAVRVIAARGVDGATTRRIAEDAQAPLATLHYCFSTKELLFAAVFRHVVAEYRDVLARNDPAAGLQTTARTLLRSLLDWYLDNPDFASAAVELVCWARRQPGDQARNIYNDVTETVRDMLTAAAAREESIPPGLVDELAYVIAATSDGFALSWVVFDDADEARKQVGITLDVLDAWLSTRLATTASAQPRPEQPTPPQKASSLVSWVSVG